MVWLNTLLNYFSTHPIQLTALLAIIAFSKSTVFLSSVLPPASVILLIGITAGLPFLPKWVMWLSISTGATAGSLISFYIGKIIVRTGMLNRLREKHKIRLLHIHRKLHENAILALFTSRFIAVLRYLVPTVAGMLSLRPLIVYCVSIVSSLAWSALYVSGSHFFYCFYF